MKRSYVIKTIKKFFNNFAGAWIFYTTFPKVPFISPEFKNIAQFAPIIGLIIGILQILLFYIFFSNSWSIQSSILICLAAGYFFTGGLHIDGLMDTIDGIYAGPKKMYKAMKDSRVGSFGVQVLLLISLIQFASLLQLQDKIIYVLPICLFWGRFSSLIYINNFKYITYKKKSISHKKKWRGFLYESFLSIFIILLMFSLLIKLNIFSIYPLKTISLFLTSLFYCFIIPNLLGNKVKGFNGDTCGASVVLVETITMFTFAIIL